LRKKAQENATEMTICAAVALHGPADGTPLIRSIRKRGSHPPVRETRGGYATPRDRNHVLKIKGVRQDLFTETRRTVFSTYWGFVPLP
jgi:hypothetical protein